MLARGNSRPDRRRRFAKACNHCRRRKSRCDGTRPVCTRCNQLSLPCVYADVDKSQPGNRRVRRSTNAVHGQRPLHVNPGAAVDNDQQHTSTSQPSMDRSLLQSPRIDLDSSHAQSPESPASRTLDTNESVFGSLRDVRYFGPSSGVSLLSLGRSPRREHDNISRNIDAPFREGCWSAWMHPCLEGAFQRRTYFPLPSWTEAFSLAHEFFDQENMTTPLFHPPTFMALLGRQYCNELDDDPAWWTSLNAVFAITKRRRLERGMCNPDEEDLPWKYAANALDAVLDVQMRNTRLLSVQALLSLAWFFVGTPNPQLSFMLAASAVRLSHSIGLHKRDCHLSLNPIEVEQRKRVFWVAVIIDHYLCFRTGRPPAQDPGDFNLNMPPELGEDGLGSILVGDGVRVNAFRANAHLSHIEAEVYSRLYTSTALSSNTQTMGVIVQKLDGQLKRWKDNMPIFRPDLLAFGAEHPVILRLHFAYYNCLIAIHRMNGRRYWTPHISHPETHYPSSILDSIDKCVDAARAILNLLDLVPFRLTSFCWDIMPFNTNALVILFVHILRQPHKTTTISDLQSMEKVLGLLLVLESPQTASYIPQIRILCKELCRLARVTIDKPCRQAPETSHEKQNVQQSTFSVPSIRQLGIINQGGSSARGLGDGTLRQSTQADAADDSMLSLWDGVGDQFQNGMPFSWNVDEFCRDFFNVDQSLER